MKWPMLATFDIDDHGRRGWVVAVSNDIAAGPQTLSNGWVIQPPDRAFVERRTRSWLPRATSRDNPGYVAFKKAWAP